MVERSRMQLASGYYNSFETVIGALEKGGQEAQAAGYVAHGACLLHAAVELRHVWEERMMKNAPVKPLLATRFKLSFNKAGNCTTFRRDQAEQLEGEWVWLINATNGMNDPLYATPSPQISNDLTYHCDVCSVPGYGDAPCSPHCDRAAQEGAKKTDSNPPTQTEACE